MHTRVTQRVRFGVFEFDLRAGELREGNRKIRLQEQPFQILRMLVERRGEIVTRDEIKKQLWPNDTIVEFDHSIQTAISKLRQALGDSAEGPKYIETVARRGYRLMVRVESKSNSASDRTFAVAEKDPNSTSHGQFSVGNLIGKKVSHYRVLEILGGGGMGVVYTAEDLKLGRRVAIKFLPEELGTDTHSLERFELEARAASALDHPNICGVYEFGEHRAQPFIVMPLLEGHTLRELIADKGNPFSIHEILDVAIQIASGLEAAHEKGIIHRDIKPANIFVTKRDETKILDFGLAKLTYAAADRNASAVAEASQSVRDVTLTRTGVALGTAAYMSPEQVRGEELDARTDLFSFGLVLYEMATGQQAFRGETAAILHDAVLNSTPTSARQLNSEIPQVLEEIIEKALQKNHKLRYHNASEMCTDLKSLRSHTNSALQASTSEPGPEHPIHPAKQRRRWRFFVFPLAGSVLVIATVFYSYFHQRFTKRLHEQDTLVLADFANTTGDTVFDGTLKQALAIQIEQSPYLNVLSDSKLNATLKLMNRAPGERLTQDVAQEVCLRNNSKAIITGSISHNENEYNIVLKALNCQTGAVLASAQDKVRGRDGVVKVLGQATDRLRRTLGESLNSIEKFSHPLDQATTSSLEALKAYTVGQSVLRDKGSAEAVPYYKRAVELDSNFARAYAALGVAYGNLNQQSLEEEYRKKACELRDRVSGRERFSIEADSCAGADALRAIQVYVQWSQTYPADAVPHLNLGNRFTQLGQHEKAAAEFREYLRLAPNSVLGYGNLIEGYLPVNRLDEAKAAAQDADIRKLDGFYLRVARYYLAFVLGDNGAMQEQVAWSIGRPAAEDLLLSAESDTQAYYGRLSEARSLSSRAAQSAQRNDEKDAAVVWILDAALREAEFGNSIEARQAVAVASGLDADYYGEFRALALARAGDASGAQKLVNKINRDFPSGTSWQVYWLPTIRAAIELDRGNAHRAIQLLDEASAYELAEDGPGQTGTMYPVYVRGLAYLKLRQPNQAALEFQKILNHRGLVQNFPLGALAHLQLARARTLGGETVGARTAYQDFLALWKDADPDIPIYKQAKAEYAKLQ
jgi:serine/threonine protein kinase/predicted Zn-dependent protease